MMTREEFEKTFIVDDILLLKIIKELKKIDECKSIYPEIYENDNDNFKKAFGDDYILLIEMVKDGYYDSNDDYFLLIPESDEYLKLVSYTKSELSMYLKSLKPFIYDNLFYKYYFIIENLYDNLSKSAVTQVYYNDAKDFL